MHQICYGFYWSIKKWSKLGQKADFFLAHLESFFVYAFLHLWVTFQNFLKWKTFIRHISAVSLISIAFVVVKGKKFYVLMQHPWNSLFWGAFGSFLPQILFNLAEVLTRDSLPIRKTQYLKNLSKFWFLAQMEFTQSLQFWSILGPIYHRKTKNIA